MPNAYAQFVKNHIHEFKHLKNTDRMKECAKLYHQMKNGGKKMPAVQEKVVKKVRGKKVTVAPEGGSFLGSIIPFGNLLGLGLDTKAKKAMPKKPRMKKGGNIVTPTMTASGGNFWDDFKNGADTALGLARHVLF